MYGSYLLITRSTDHHQFFCEVPLAPGISIDGSDPAAIAPWTAQPPTKGWWTQAARWVSKAAAFVGAAAPHCKNGKNGRSPSEGEKTST